jgi:hypothetical protein
MFSLRRNLSSHATHTYRLTVLQDHNRAAAHSKKTDPRQLGTAAEQLELFRQLKADNAKIRRLPLSRGSRKDAFHLVPVTI